MTNYSCAAVVLGSIIAGSTSLSAFSSDYPSATVRVVIPFPPGGSSDLVARTYTTVLSERWKKTIVIENRPGGNAMLAPTAVARSKPDGHTLLLGAPTLATARATMRDLPIDPIKDLDAVTQLVETPYIVAVNASLPVSDLKSFVELTKKEPGKFYYGAWGTTGELIYGLLKERTGAELTHVGYKGEAITVNAVSANEIQAVFATSVNVIPAIQKGTIRALAITGDQRLSNLPDVPTAAEAGVADFKATVWFGIFAPAGTPESIKRKLASEISEISKIADVQTRLASVGMVAKVSDPDEFSRFLMREEQQWMKVAKTIGIVPR